MDFSKPKGTRRRLKTSVSRTRAGKLYPTAAVRIRGNEGGVISQRVILELDPILGRLRSQVTADMTVVYVPLQAIDALMEPAAAYAGMTEVVREKLLTGNPLFSFENETDISRAMDIEPISISGAKRVSAMIRPAHNAAVNLLRQKRYHKAALLGAASSVITPAILRETVLDKFNAALDPDDRINGTVQLSLPTMRLPVDGIYTTGSTPVYAAGQALRGTTAANDMTSTSPASSDRAAVPLNTATPNAVAIKVTGGSPATVRPDVYAQLNGTTAGNVSLLDFYNAEKMDMRVREMREIIEKYPEFGEEMVLRWAHGLQVDTGKTPIILAERMAVFGREIVSPTDTSGVVNDTMRSYMAVEMNVTVPVPRSELGGVIITFITVRPDETFDNQPDPDFTETVTLDNYLADEMSLDPVPVTMRQLDSGVPLADETTVAFYTGLNALKQNYISYGLARNMDENTVENRNSIWQIKVPMSVTPENILYPVNMSHRPFADQNADVVSVMATTVATLTTPMIFGPSPVETLAVIDDENLFEDE